MSDPQPETLDHHCFIPSWWKVTASPIRADGGAPAKRDTKSCAWTGCGKPRDADCHVSIDRTPPPPVDV